MSFFLPSLVILSPWNSRWTGSFFYFSLNFCFPTYHQCSWGQTGNCPPSAAAPVQICASHSWPPGQCTGHPHPSPVIPVWRALALLLEFASFLLLRVLEAVVAGWCLWVVVQFALFLYISLLLHTLTLPTCLCPRKGKGYITFTLIIRKIRIIPLLECCISLFESYLDRIYCSAAVVLVVVDIDRVKV